MKKIINYLNPVARLGKPDYSIRFSLIANVALSVLSEFYAYRIAHDPLIVGVYIIFLNVAFVIYFSFRDGIRAGFISAAISVLYYFYIIQTRHYAGAQLTSGIVATILLGILYFALAGIIGGLKQRIDNLIEREANEKIRLQTILQQLPVGVLITDEQGRVIQSNKQIEIISGVKVPRGYKMGIDKGLVPGKINNKPVNVSQSPLYQSLKNGKPVVGREISITRKDGKQKFIQINASTILNKQGKTIAGASIITDMTAQKELEARKDDFVNIASHELKTPITSMKLYLDLLHSRIQNVKDEKAGQAFLQLKAQTNKLQDLVNDLLDVSRLQTGKLSFNKEFFSIDALIEETISALQTTTKQQKIIFKKSTPLLVYADRFRLYQVLTNLITNAIKYSPKGENIYIRARKTDSRITVSVQDSGMGIEKDEQRKVFDRLYQVSSDNGKTFPGFGMGLYISKAIIKHHQGRIWVESEIGKGSTFYFTLPKPTKKPDKIIDHELMPRHTRDSLPLSSRRSRTL